ncbi:Hypothetical_protein [Hexamita inflata]|uniref:Hypothetical_protein n=1 Tax=Hexamita inflata TaxID=28002 RepID=A0AA86Q1D2_9EUKA|nr:Hypothetical protein HINF_LOCUS37063 [Hexamita inflata]
MSSNLFSSIGKEPSLNEQPDYSYTGVFTSVNTAQVQILQEEPQTPTVAPVQHVEPVQPTQPPVNRRIALRSTNKIRLSFSVDLKKKVIDYYKQMMKQCPCSALHLTRVFFAQRYHQLPIDHPQAVYATGNQSGWMTYEAMYDYLTQVIYPYIKKYGHIILTLDNCSSHNIDKIKQKLREDYQTFISSGKNRVTFFEEFLVAMDTYCHVIYVPKNTTPQNQVLDVSVNGPFKAYLRGIHHQYCVEQHRILKNANSHLALTPEDKKIKIPRHPELKADRQIMKAIALISPNVVIHGFEKIGILRTSTSTVPPTLYVSKGGHQIMGFAKFSYQKRIWTYCDNENNIGLDQILFPKDDIEDDDEDILNGLPMMPSQE